MLHKLCKNFTQYKLNSYSLTSEMNSFGWVVNLSEPLFSLHAKLGYLPHIIMDLEWNFTEKYPIWSLVHSRCSVFPTLGYSWSIFLQSESFESCIASGSRNSVSSGISETKSLVFLLSFHHQNQQLLEWRMEWPNFLSDFGKISQ